MINNLISILAVCSTIAVSIVGYPSQIREIRKAKHLKALSIVFFCLSFTAFSLFTLHGYFINDKTVLIGQGLGAVGSGVTLCVLFYSLYHQRRRKQQVSGKNTLAVSDKKLPTTYRIAKSGADVTQI